MGHWGNNMDTQGMTIKYGGNVGIGTSNPNHKLEVNSTNSSVFFNINIFYLRFYNSGQFSLRQTTSYYCASI